MNKKLLSFAQNLPHYTAIGWGLLILFALAGVLFGHRDAGALMCEITVTMWCAMKIGNDAGSALRALTTKNKDDTTDK